MAFDVSEQWIDRAEQELGVVLPSAYRDALRVSNGGEVELAEDDVWTLYGVLDPSDRKRLARSAPGLVREQNTAREWTGFPQRAIAIADDGAGNRLIFQVIEGRCEDFVWLWNHETAALSYVAADFGELRHV